MPIFDAVSPAGGTAGTAATARQRGVQRGRRSPGEGRRRQGWRTLLSATLATVLAAAALPLAVLPAQAAVGGTVGPVDPAIGLPTFFGDTAGTKLAPCLDGLPMCTATPDDFVAPAGEVFYNLTQANVGPFKLVLAVEGAFLDGLPIVFQRVRYYSPQSGLVPNATYKITEPYGTHTVVTDGNGKVSTNAGTNQTGCQAGPCGDFVTALDGPITSSNFLTWDTYTGVPGSAGAPPAGYVGDNATPHKITGSPTGTNFFKVDGPNIGGPGVNTSSTDLFTVLGKVIKGPGVGMDPTSLPFGNKPIGVPVTSTVTLTSKGVDPLFVGGTDPAAAAVPPAIAGPQAGQYAVGADTCTGNSFPAGAKCTVDVIYTPVAGASSATMTIPTNAGPQDVVLSGQSSPAAGVSPATTSTAPASFGSVLVGKTSAAKTFTLTNTGGAPMTVAGVSISPNPNDFALDPASSCAAAGTVVLDPVRLAQRS